MGQRFLSIYPNSRSSALLHTQEVTGSSPAVSTTTSLLRKWGFSFIKNDSFLLYSAFLLFSQQIATSLIRLSIKSDMSSKMLWNRFWAYFAQNCCTCVAPRWHLRLSPVRRRPSAPFLFCGFHADSECKPAASYQRSSALQGIVFPWCRARFQTIVWCKCAGVDVAWHGSQENVSF